MQNGSYQRHHKSSLTVDVALELRYQKVSSLKFVMSQKRARLCRKKENFRISENSSSVRNKTQYFHDIHVL
jgi:hypothetical protein